MRKFLRIIFSFLFLVSCSFGCATTTTNPDGSVTTSSGIETPSCADIVSYIATIDAIAASWPTDVYSDEIKAAKAWYLVARTGAIAGLSKKCPELVTNLSPAIQVQ